GRIHYSGNWLLMPTISVDGGGDLTGATNGTGNAFNSTINGGNGGFYNIDWSRRGSSVFLTTDGAQYNNENVSGRFGNSLGALFNMSSAFSGGDAHQFYVQSDTDNQDSIEEGPNEDSASDLILGQPRWRHAGSAGQANGSNGGGVNVLFIDGHASTVVRGEFLLENIRPDL
ncbi:MAG: hypothetical protein AAGE65_15375, partial [Planctomycetota bacterium]